MSPGRSEVRGVGIGNICRRDGSAVLYILWKEVGINTMKHSYMVLVLLSATAQQSYCHDVGVRRPSVRRPSVDIVFSENAKWIDTKFL